MRRSPQRPSRHPSGLTGSISTPSTTHAAEDHGQKHRTAPRERGGVFHETKQNEPASRHHPSTTCNSCRRNKSKSNAESATTKCSQCRQRQTRCVFKSPDRQSARESEEELKRADYVANLEEYVEQMEALLHKFGKLPQDYIDDISHLEGDKGCDFDDQSSSDTITPSQQDFDQTTSGDASPDYSFKSPTGSELTGNPSKRSRKDDSTPSRGGGSSAPSVATPITPGSETYFMDRESVDSFPSDSLAVSKEPLSNGGNSMGSLVPQPVLQWIRERTRDQDVLKSLEQLSSGSCCISWRPDVFHDVFSCHVYRTLPPRPEVFAMLRNYFKYINRVYPLFHEETYMRMVEKQYTEQTCKDVTRWASINILVALGMRYRANTPKSEKNIERSWYYFKNAISVLTEITLRCGELLVPQTLLAMALFIRGHCGITPTLSLSSAALRACHVLGCHKRAYRPDLTPVEQEQRRRVFWVAFFFDQSLAMQAGQPSTQSFQDFDVDLPNVDPFESSISTPEGPSWGISFFRTICQQTVIRNKIYNRLYSSKSFAMSLEEMQASVDELNAEMEAWKAQNPFWRPLDELDPSATGLKMYTQVGAQIYYSHSEIMINRMPLIYESIHLSLRDEQNRLLPSERLSSICQRANSVCIQAARNILNLIDLLPWGEIGIFWYYIDYLFLAVMVLASSCVRDPQKAAAMRDPDILNKARVYFSTIAPQDGRSKSAKYMATWTTIIEKTVRKICERYKKNRRRDTKERGRHLKETLKSAPIPADSVSNTRQKADDPPPTRKSPERSENTVAKESEVPQPAPSSHSSSLPVENPSGIVDHQPHLHSLQNENIPMADAIFTSTITQSDLNPPLSQPDGMGLYYHGAPWFYADNTSMFSLDGTVIPAEILQFPVPSRWELIDSNPEIAVQESHGHVTLNSIANTDNGNSAFQDQDVLYNQQQTAQYYSQSPLFAQSFSTTIAEGTETIHSMPPMPGQPTPVTGWNQSAWNPYGY